VNHIGETGDISVTLLDDALALTSAAWAVAGVSVGEQKADTGWVHDSLLHWETLLVVTTGDSEDISLEFISNAVTWNFCAHSVQHVRNRSRLLRTPSQSYLLSMKMRSFLSSSTSMSFWLPLAGCVGSQFRYSEVFFSFATGSGADVRRRCSKKVYVSSYSKLYLS